MCEQIFGLTLTLSTGRVVPVRWIAEQHVKEDLSRIPTASDWLSAIKIAGWMMRDMRVEETLMVSDSPDFSPSSKRITLS